MQSERFCSLTRLKGTKFAQDWKVEFKKSYQVYHQNFFKRPYKSGLKFHPFCVDESEQNEAKGYFYAQRRPFSTKDQNLMKF